jgi:hypothetical protein
VEALVISEPVPPYSAMDGQNLRLRVAVPKKWQWTLPVSEQFVFEMVMLQIADRIQLLLPKVLESKSPDFS